MGLQDKIAHYKEFKQGVSHCTFNPEGPGVVRIHLIPPKFRLFGNSAYIVILNGYYLLPIGRSWALLLSFFMKEVNRYDGKPIGEAQEAQILKNTVGRMHGAYPFVTRDTLREDLYEMLDVLFAVAHGEGGGLDLEKLSIRAYAKHMTAPHRVDLMVSAMTDEAGGWKCNQKCTFCYAAGQARSGARELDTGEWKAVIDKLIASNVPMLTFTGGEPTLREDIDLLIAHAKACVTRLNTNGILLTRELVAKLKAAGLDSVQITLYSHDATVHNALVGATRFEDTVQGIRNAVEGGLDVSVNTPLCKKNADYERTLAFIRSLGVRFVTASGLICTGMASTAHKAYDLTQGELIDIITAAKHTCDDADMEIDFTSPGLLPRKVLEDLGMNVPMCGAALSNMAVAPDGEVIPCQSWLAASAGLGNILVTDFKKIWKHKRCTALRGMTECEALECPFRKGASD